MDDGFDDFDDFMMFEAPMYLDDEEDDSDYHPKPFSEGTGCEKAVGIMCAIGFILFFLMIMCSG